MNPPDVKAGQWNVTVRPRGEILTASTSDPSMELGVLGVPGGYSPSEIEGWLHDLIGVARETGREDTQVRPIPALLHHGLTGLLFSHAQLWNRDGERHPASYAILRVEGTLAFGWVGDASIVTKIDGATIEPDSIIIRDEDGREARAFEISDAEAVELRMEWTGGEGGEPLAVLEAHWAGADANTDPPQASTSMDETSLRDLLEISNEPHLVPGGPVVPMEGIVRETVPGLIATTPEQSFFEPSSEPLDLDAGRPPLAAQEPPAMAAAAATEVPVALDIPADIVEADASRAVSLPEQLSMEPTVATALFDDTFDSGENVEADAEPVDESVAASRPGRLQRLFGRFAFWRRPASATDDISIAVDDDTMTFDVPGVPDQVPPTPESAEITERAVHDYEQFDSSDIEWNTEADYEPFEPTEMDWIDEAAPASTQEPAQEAPVASEMTIPAPAIAHAVPEPLPIPAPVIAIQSEPIVAEAPVAPTAEAVLIEPHIVDVDAGPSVEPQPVHDVITDAGNVRTPLRPQWPSADQMKPPVPLFKRPWVWGALMAALFAGGWMVGHMNDEGRTGAARGVRNVLRSVGLGGAQYEVMINSRPPGAWISVDGNDIARRTPASIELKAGEHDVTLSFSDLGAATFQVRGVDGDRLALDPPLWGSLNIYSSDAEMPVAVSVDGVARGFAPLRVDSLQPGAHEVRFSGPGLPSWGQTVQVRVNEPADLIARPMTSPATGVIEVRASLTSGAGTVEVEGASVWLDSEPAGTTPLTLELPRGPHSIRIEHLGESTPVQMIDLPGGNQRFASFTLRPGMEQPTLAPLNPPAEIPLDEPTVVSAELEGVQSVDVREMWMHVQTPDGPWRRYQMAWLKSPGGVVGVAVFPTTLFDADGRVRYYTSASTQAGDEYYSEVRVAARPAAAPPKPKPGARTRKR